MKTISFLMPCRMNFPAGGFKIALEYANRLVDCGYNVNFIIPAVLYTLKNHIAGIFRYPYYKISGNYTPRKWFNTNKKINFYFVKSLRQKNVIDSDIYIATSVETSYYLNKYKTNAEKIYFIQDFEAWDMSEKQVLKSFTFDMKKIVISPWLLDKVKEIGETAILIPNGFDFSRFSYITPADSRNKFSLLVMHHKDERKRCTDSYKAIAYVKQKYPQIKVKLFGVPKRPKNLTFDFEYFQKPNPKTLNELYNDAAIYIAASEAEGFGLTVGEAMICGCSVACTDNNGFRIMIEHEKTGLLSRVYDWESLGKNIIRLIEDDNLRLELAEKGRIKLQDFSLEKSFEKFLYFLEN